MPPELNSPDDTLLGKLLVAIDDPHIPKQKWEDAAQRLPRLPIEDRAVSMVFINEWERSLRALAPADYEKLNSYVLQGTKSSDCRCTPDDECTHWHKSATKPELCKEPWIIRSFTSKTTSLSVVETFVVAAELTGDKSFTHDANGQPYFGRATVFPFLINYLGHVTVFPIWSCDGIPHF